MLQGARRITATLAVVAAITCPTLADASSTPVLGDVFGSNQQGFGRAHPSHIYAGGDPTSIVKHIHWHGWRRP